MHEPVAELQPFKRRGVSVVICGKNEAENFTRNLPKILVQEYNPLEVVVVDDHSDDETNDVLEGFTKEFDNLTIILAEMFEDKPGKKLALQTGIKAAMYDWIVVTDADCRPASKRWISYMVEPLSKGKKLSIGVSPYSTRKGWLNKLIHYETNLTAVQYISFALSGMPYMGVGRNMAYTKDFFLGGSAEMKGKNLASGDDDLLVNHAASATDTAVVLHPDSFTYSPACETFNGWLRQKSRHQTAGILYKPIHIFLLFLFGASFMLFYWLLIPLFFGGYFYSVIAILIILGITVGTIMGACYKKINPQGYKTELGSLYAFIWPWIMLRSLFIKKTKWS